MTPADPFRFAALVAAFLDDAGIRYVVGGSVASSFMVRKLAWFRMGGEQSERQWRDVLGMFRLLNDRLDGSYLAGASERFGVADLLDRLRRDAV